MQSLPLQNRAVTRSQKKLQFAPAYLNRENGLL
jgi:hypothetical protein